jgi:hypothetical protein
MDKQEGAWEDVQPLRSSTWHWWLWLIYWPLEWRERWLAKRGKGFYADWPQEGREYHVYTLDTRQG